MPLGFGMWFVENTIQMSNMYRRIGLGLIGINKMVANIDV